MKQTEIGVIPEDWEVKELGSISEKVMVGIASAATHAYTDKGVIMFRNQNIKPNYLNTDEVLYIKNDYEILFKNKRLKEGDLLTARTGYPGTTAIVPKGYSGSQSFTTLITRLKSDINSSYISQYMNSDEGVKFFEANQIGGGQKNVNSAILQKMPIPLPPLAEQEAIANALSDADAWIEKLEQLIAKKRLIKQGAMQTLLTPKDDWEVKKLGEVCQEGGLIRGPFGGALKKEFFVKKGFKVYEQKNAIYKSVDLGNYYIDLNKFKELSRFEIREDDFILSCSGTIGKLYRIPKVFEKGIINQALLIIRLNNSLINHSFFNHIFQYDTIQAKIIDDTQGGAMKNLVGMSEFRNTEIPLPSLSEQERIATILSDMDAEIEALEQQLGKARQIKQGMMQELLTGRTRLVKPN